MLKSRMHYVYLLKLNNGQIYTGYTNNIGRRLGEHESGNVTFTSHRLPVKLIHYEVYLLKSDATRRERYLKITEGKQLLRKQIRDALTSEAIET